MGDTKAGELKSERLRLAVGPTLEEAGERRRSKVQKCYSVHFTDAPWVQMSGLSFSE